MLDNSKTGNILTVAILTISSLIKQSYSISFSDTSSYYVDINWSNDDSFNIDFNRHRVYKLSTNGNTNNACELMVSGGKFFKNGSFKLALQLYLFLISIYYRQLDKLLLVELS